MRQVERFYLIEHLRREIERNAAEIKRVEEEIVDSRTSEQRREALRPRLAAAQGALTGLNFAVRVVEGMD